MKFLELADSEVELLKEMLLMAVWNGNHISNQEFDSTPEQYKIIKQLFFKISN